MDEARFEDCTFDRCRFEGLFSYSADFVHCRFTGPVRGAIPYGVDPDSGRRNDITGNDFRAAILNDRVELRGDFPLASQHWPPEYQPRHQPG